MNCMLDSDDNVECLYCMSGAVYDKVTKTCKKCSELKPGCDGCYLNFGVDTSADNLYCY